MHKGGEDKEPPRKPPCTTGSHPWLTANPPFAPSRCHVHSCPLAARPRWAELKTRRSSQEKGGFDRGDLARTHRTRTAASCPQPRSFTALKPSRGFSPSAVRLIKPHIRRASHNLGGRFMASDTSYSSSSGNGKPKEGFAAGEGRREGRLPLELPREGST